MLFLSCSLSMVLPTRPITPCVLGAKASSGRGEAVAWGGAS